MSRELNILNEMNRLRESSADIEYMLVIDYDCLGLSKSASESDMRARVNEYLSHVGQKKSNNVLDAGIGVGVMYTSESEVRKVANLLAPVLLPGEDMQLITYEDDEPLDDAEEIPVTNTNMVDMSPDEDDDEPELNDFALRYSARAFLPGFKGNSIRSKEAKDVVNVVKSAGVTIKADQVTNLDYNDVTIMLVDTTKSKAMDIAKKLAKSLPKDEKWYKNVSKGIELIGPFDSTLEDDDDDEGGMAEAPVEVVAITNKETVTESVTDAVLESLEVAKDTIGVARSLSTSDSKLSERLDLVLESMDLIMKSVTSSPKKIGLSELLVTPDVGLLKVADSHEDIHGLAESLGFSKVSDDSYELEGESNKLILESASGDLEGVVLYGMTSESTVLDKDEFNSMLEELNIDIVE